MALVCSNLGVYTALLFLSLSLPLPATSAIMLLKAVQPITWLGGLQLLAYNVYHKITFFR